MTRYLVAETGKLRASHQVLLSPTSFREPEWTTHRFHVALSKEKVRNSPSVDSNRPVSRQHERGHLGYFGYAPYWDYPGLWGMGPDPASLMVHDPGRELSQAGSENDDVHLHSAREVRGYRVRGSDDTIGHVADFIIDDHTWVVRYIVVNTHHWWFGKKVLMDPSWAHSVSWESREVAVAISRQTIAASPAWTPDAPINRAYEARLYDYYGRPQYWIGNARPHGSPHEQPRLE